MKRKRASARNPAPALQGTPATTPPTRNTVSALAVLKVLFGFSSVPTCEEASVQVLGLRVAGPTSLPPYRKSRCHTGRALLNDLHPLKESGGRRSRVYSSRRLVRARDCPSRRDTSAIVPLSGVRVVFIAPSHISSSRQGSHDGELVSHFGPSLRWGTSVRGARKKGRMNTETLLVARVAFGLKSLAIDRFIENPVPEQRGMDTIHLREDTKQWSAYIAAVH